MEKYPNTQPYRRRRERALDGILSYVRRNQASVDKIINDTDHIQALQIKTLTKSLARLHQTRHRISHKLKTVNSVTRKYAELTAEHESLAVQIREAEHLLVKLSSNETKKASQKEILEWQKTRFGKKIQEALVLCQRLNRDTPKELHEFAGQVKI